MIKDDSQTLVQHPMLNHPYKISADKAYKLRDGGYIEPQAFLILLDYAEAMARYEQQFRTYYMAVSSPKSAGCSDEWKAIQQNTHDVVHGMIDKRLRDKLSELSQKLEELGVTNEQRVY